MENILMDNTSERVFEPLPMRRRALEPVPPNLYRIVSLRGDTKHLQAVTAYEAFRDSGFSQALKIERMVNIKHEVIENNKFIDNISFQFREPHADITSEKEDPSLIIKRRTIVSADELDSLIKSIQEMALAKDNSNKLVATQVPVFQSLDEGLVPGPTGLDVHGDGFDEIIPGMPPKSAGVKPPEAVELTAAETSEDRNQATNKAELSAVSPHLMEPERELSSEEIEGLLSGNAPDVL